MYDELKLVDEQLKEATGDNRDRLNERRQVLLEMIGSANKTLTEGKVLRG
jgi:hypothetical protein